MATVETALYTRLTTHAGVTALASSRTYALTLPQKPTYPAITYQRISGLRISAMGADTGLARPRFQVSSWAQTFEAAVALKEQVRAALQRWRATLSGLEILDTNLLGEAQLYDPDAKVYQAALDVEVVHREA